jgi:hypothetical protein
MQCFSTISIKINDVRKQQEVLAVPVMGYVTLEYRKLTEELLDTPLTKAAHCHFQESFKLKDS